MDRRHFIKNTGLLTGGLALGGSAMGGYFDANTEPWFDKAMRWAQLAFVETDPGNYDPDFWLNYFKKIHADGVLLSAGGIVAFYPTEIPFHHRSDWLNNKDVLGYLVKECRKMNMSVVLRTDPHATRQDMYNAHPDYIAVTADGQQRRHWANPDLWVTCALGPYNFDFMTKVNHEIMERYQPDGIFSNRWHGHGVCYCQHCKENFKKASGLELPLTSNRLDPNYQQWVTWQTDRLKELWFLWDAEIRKQKPNARFIPNGFPDKLLTGKHSDFFFADQQARRGVIPPWSNARGAKELRAGLGMKPLIGIFSVGIEEEFRWKDSVQNDAEIRVWVAEGVASGMKPCFVKFGGVIYDKRWMDAVAEMYQSYYKNEKYLRNTAPVANVGVVYSEQTNLKYGGQPWQQNSRDHETGMYQVLVEDHMPFEMVNDKMLDEAHLKPFKLLILPNIAALSDEQCSQLKKFVQDGGSLVATFETSLYDEQGKPRKNFALADLFGVDYDNGIEGPMRNSYLTLNNNPGNSAFKQLFEGLENTPRVINSVYRAKVKPTIAFPDPVTLIPSYPDLPMEDVFPRIAKTDDRQIYLRVIGKGRVVYLPSDMDRSFWQMMSSDHSKLMRNAIHWALNEQPLVTLDTKGVIDVAVWRQKSSMTVHLVNLTNPMMMKGPFRDIFPVSTGVSVKLPENAKVNGVQLLMAGTKPEFKNNNGTITLQVPGIETHEIVAIDFA